MPRASPGVVGAVGVIAVLTDGSRSSGSATAHDSTSTARDTPRRWVGNAQTIRILVSACATSYKTARGTDSLNRAKHRTGQDEREKASTNPHEIPHPLCDLELAAIVSGKRRLIGRNMIAKRQLRAYLVSCCENDAARQARRLVLHPRLGSFHLGCACGQYHARPGDRPARRPAAIAQACAPRNSFPS